MVCASSSRDHPRVRGEKRKRFRHRPKTSGSPPRVRGKGRRHTRPPGGDRITPARAGKSLRGLSVSTWKWDHPRACGEKHPILTSCSAQRGITPARAGKSIAARRSPGSSRDHPRACGEKAQTGWRQTGSTGSPPRVRGKEGEERKADFIKGITPARAGKRPLFFQLRPVTWDHPRACGEKDGRTVHDFERRGSPPRVRGKGIYRQFPFLAQRITPARAGKSYGRTTIRAEGWDHPRACGEKSFLVFPKSLSLGSPPRVRGKAYVLALGAG